MKDLNEIDKVTYTMDFLQLIAYGAGFANLPTTAAKDIASARARKAAAQPASTSCIASRVSVWPRSSARTSRRKTS